MESTQKLTRTEIKILAINLLIAVCGGLGIDIHLASLPYIMRDLHTNQEHMQQSVSLFLFGIASSILFYGPLSDKYGRRPIVIFGLALGAFASFASVFSESIQYFLAMRLLQGIGMGVCSGLTRAILADTLTGIRFILIGSWLSLITSFSPLFAPMMGGYLQQWFGWQSNFITLGLALLLALFLYGFFCPETNYHQNPNAFTLRGLYDSYKTLLLHAIFIASTLLAGIGLAAIIIYATVSSFIFQTQYHLSPVFYGWITTMMGAGNLIGKIANSLSIRMIGSNKTMLIGLFILLIAGVWLSIFIALHSVTMTIIIVAVFATMFCQTFITISATSYAVTPFYNKRGAASALFGSFQMLIAFFCSAVVGAIALNGVMILAMAYLILGTFGVITYFTVLAKNTTHLITE
ncbi:MAG: hypothetical protein A3F10_02210 [Coxiella sp. RIFCSPHIGHO2_12_FULL_42_15]|nr:MAG: hypothetical protein A3F10_02210 [Coxiella sp. RIFCSPHIGHO2_12_FULL_42_15]